MTIINKIIDGKMYAEKLLKEIHPLSKGFLHKNMMDTDTLENIIK